MECLLITRLDLFSLKLFIDIVDLGSIGKGAEKNFIAVSAASKRIAELEHELGAQLLQRQARGVAVTQAGLAFYKGAQDTFMHLQRVATEVHELASGKRQPVRLYANLTAMMCHLPDAVASFCARHPSIKVDLHEQSTSTTLKAVSRGEADIGIVAPIVPYPDDLRRFRYQHVRLAVVVSPRHALGLRTSVTFEQAAVYDFIGLDSEGAWDRMLSKFAQERGCPFNVRVRVHGFDAMCRMIASNLGVGIVPLPVAVQCSASMGLRVLTLEEPWADVPLDLCTRAPESMSEGARLLFDHLRAYVGGHPLAEPEVSLLNWAAAATPSEAAALPL